MISGSCAKEVRKIDESEDFFKDDDDLFNRIASVVRPLTMEIDYEHKSYLQNVLLLLLLANKYP